MKKYFLVIFFFVAIGVMAASCSTPPTPAIPTPTPTPTVQEKFERSLSGSSNKAASTTLWIIGAIPFVLTAVLGYSFFDPQYRSQGYIAGILVSSISGILAGFVIFVAFSVFQDQMGILFDAGNLFPGTGAGAIILEIVLFVVGVIGGLILFWAIYKSMTSRYIGIVNLVLIAVSAIGIHSIKSAGFMNLVTSYLALGVGLGLLLHAIWHPEKLKRIFVLEFPFQE